MSNACVYCVDEGGHPIWSDGRCRVVLADETFAGFCRVIWNAHVCELTDLPASDRRHFLDIAVAVETALRRLLRPTKINLASLGNVTPHLHWHVIPRFADDSHFPNPVWGAQLRDAPKRPLPDRFVNEVAKDIAASLAPA